MRSTRCCTAPAQMLVSVPEADLGAANQNSLAAAWPRRLQTPAAVAAIFAVTLVAYLPSLRGGLLWDDGSHITAHRLQTWGGLYRIWFQLGTTQQYYPILHSAFWIEHRLWGDSVIGYHLINLALHATAACLFGLVLARLRPLQTGWPWAEWLAAAVFALHPVCAESVAWISEQKNTLSLVFYLLSALAYLRFDRVRRPRWFALAFLLFTLALLSKSVTATLPAALLLLIALRRGELTFRRDGSAADSLVGVGRLLGTIHRLGRTKFHRCPRGGLQSGHRREGPACRPSGVVLPRKASLAAKPRLHLSSVARRRERRLDRGLPGGRGRPGVAVGAPEMESGPSGGLPILCGIPFPCARILQRISVHFLLCRRPFPIPAVPGYNRIGCRRGVPGYRERHPAPQRNRPVGGTVSGGGGGGRGAFDSASVLHLAPVGTLPRFSRPLRGHLGQKPGLLDVMPTTTSAFI